MNFDRVVLDTFYTQWNILLMLEFTTLTSSKVSSVTNKNILIENSNTKFDFPGYKTNLDTGSRGILSLT